MNIILLTHERELSKTSNTGRLVKASLGEMVELVIWRRKEPDPALISKLEKGRTALVYPTTETEEKEPHTVGCFDAFVILDATWQQARKMYNQSPYLRNIPKISLDSVPDSRYKLRRNQREGCLCTAECVVELLKQGKQFLHAEQLQSEFELMNSVQ